MTIAPQTSATHDRAIKIKSSGRAQGPTRRLMSPSDLGEVLKPFVFLDLFESDTSVFGNLPLHPHSGIGTITVVTDGEMRFDDPQSGKGVIAYGGLEWMRAGGGAWHGDEMSAGASATVQGFQLWVALPPELEDAEAQSQFIEAGSVPQVGQARVIVGQYSGARSPARSPDGITYLLVTLAVGETWTFQPPAGQSVAFLSVAKGELDVAESVHAGEIAAFEPGETPIPMKAGANGAVFVIGSAVPHRHDLVLGYHSVHTSAEALTAGEARIKALRPH